MACIQHLFCSKERLRTIVDTVISTEDSPTDTFDSLNEDVEHAENAILGDLPEKENGVALPEVPFGITYDQFEVIMGVIARYGHKLGGERVPVETKLR